MTYSFAKQYMVLQDLVKIVKMLNKVPNTKELTLSPTIPESY